MNNVSLCFVNNRKGHGSAKVASSVELRATFNRKTKYISTGIKVTTSEWKDGKVVRRKDAFELNEELSQFMAKASRVVRDMKDEDFIDLSALGERMKLVGTTITFWDYVRARKESKMGIRETTRERYNTFLDKIMELGMFKSFSDINERNIRKYDDLLRGEGKEQSTIHSYHKWLKQFINDAICDGYMKENPYTKNRIVVDRGESGMKKFLTEEEVDKIKCVSLNDCLDRVRDLFLFACYTGLSYIDLVGFSKSQVSELNGVKIIDGARGKNGKEYMLVLLKPALEILEKYEWELPRLSNQKYNEYLKVVAQLAGVDKPVSSHWARHTSAMTMLNNGVSIEVVAKVLGHTNIRTTQKTYAMIREKAVIREMSKLDK